MNKGFTVQKDVINHRIIFKVISLENVDLQFIAALKHMKLWYSTREKAQMKCDENIQKYTHPLRNWGGKGNAKHRSNSK